MRSTKALSLDLRERVVSAYEAKEGTIKEVARRFKVGEATLVRLLARKRRTGSLAPSPTRGRPARATTAEDNERVRELVLARPDATVQELTDAYNEGATRVISRSTVGRVLSELGFTRKKKP